MARIHQPLPPLKSTCMPLLNLHNCIFFQKNKINGTWRGDSHWLFPINFFSLQKKKKKIKKKKKKKLDF
jgi:hypothetical protein